MHIMSYLKAHAIGLSCNKTSTLSFKGPPIAKQIRVYKQYNLLDVEYPEVKATRVEHPEGLKQRWRPFGWGKVLGGIQSPVGYTQPSHSGP